jgi:DNA-binding IclR family transcriptional regulator
MSDDMIGRVLAAANEHAQALKELADQCGNGPAGIAAREHIAKTLSDIREKLYAVAHGEEPPCELPETWDA